MNKGYFPLSKTILWFILSLVYLILALYLYFTFYKIVAAITVALFGIFFGFYPLLKIHLIASKQEKQLLLLYNEPPELTTYFYDDNIKTINSANNAELKLDYDKIIKLRQTKNLYLLILNEKIVVVVNKNGFEKGTCEEFEKFIISKAVKAKNKL